MLDEKPHEVLVCLPHMLVFQDRTLRTLLRKEEVSEGLASGSGWIWALHDEVRER